MTKISFLFVFWVQAIAYAGALDKGFPAVIDLNRYDISALAGKTVVKGLISEKDEKNILIVSDRVARTAVNFRYIRAAGVKAALFQSSYVDSNNRKFTADDSFRVWAAAIGY